MLESDVDAFEYDYEPEDWPEYEPERRPGVRSRGRPYRPTVAPPVPRPQSYTPQMPSASGPVTRADLTRALQRVAGDIDRLKAGARATTGQINDLADRSGRAFRNVQTSQQQQAVRTDRSVAATRELAVLGSLLGGGGGNNMGVLLLLLLAGDNQQVAADGQPPTGGLGGLGGGGNSTLLLALALSGALGNP